MNLAYAVDRLYACGWIPNGGSGSQDLEFLPDGRTFPTLPAVQREFQRAGLRLEIKHNPKFSCYRATWSPADESPDPARQADDRHGTVVGACEREAAVYALAQLREHQLTPV